MSNFLRETRLVFVRNMLVTIRTPVWVFLGLFQPVLYLLLFAPLLNNVQMEGFGDTKAINIFAPGLLVLTAIFGTGFAGFNVIEDLRNGVVERFRVTPASRVALLLGMVLRDVVIFLVQCALLLGVAALMGLDIKSAGGLVMLFGLMALLALMMASISYALAMILKDEGSLAATLSTFTQPLMLLSGVLLPLTLAPKWMQTAADVTPFSHAVDATRSLVGGDLGDNGVALGFGITAALAIVAMLWATRVFRSATA